MKKKFKYMTVLKPESDLKWFFSTPIWVKEKIVDIVVENADHKAEFLEIIKKKNSCEMLAYLIKFSKWDIAEIRNILMDAIEWWWQYAFKAYDANFEIDIVSEEILPE